MNYTKKQAADFLKKYGATIKIQRSLSQTAPQWVKKDEKHGYKYDILIERGADQYGFNFWDSIANKEKESQSMSGRQLRPSAYDIIACLTKHDPGTFEDFAAEYGYNDLKLSEYPTVKKIYHAVMDEYQNIRRLFPEDEVMEELREIY